MKKAAVSSILVAVVLLALVVTAEAQQPKKLPKIGFLSSGGEGTNAWRESFVREFGKLGYVEGKNVAFEFRNANTMYDRLTVLANLPRPFGGRVRLSDHQLAGQSIERVEESIAVGHHHDLPLTAANRHLAKYRDVIGVPVVQVMWGELVMPPDLSGVSVDRND